ncbi:MAG TPA: hypothetical protein V6D06_12505 [Trichocoleus sp.]
MQPFSGRSLAIAAEGTATDAGEATASCPGLSCLQTQSFLVLTNCSWETVHGPIACHPFKIFGWNPTTQDFTLCLFDGSLTDLETYAELYQEGNYLLLYQTHPDAQLCYVYRPQFSTISAFYPIEYSLQVLVCVDGETWDVVAEGEYR